MPPRDRGGPPGSAPVSAPPLVIAHRGASGYLPEHTREAKVLAYGQGADYLEQDIVATADGELVVMHDIHLDDVTNVADRFPERRRRDGRFYVIDFGLDELRELTLLERRRHGTEQRVFPDRFAEDELDFRIVTFDEELRLVRALNATTGRAVGVYPEIKAPAFHHAHGIDLAALLLAALGRYGYVAADDLAVLQCFDAAELKRCRDELGTSLKLAQLSEAGSSETDAAAFDAIAVYAQIWAPHYSALLTPGPVTTSSFAVGEPAREASRAGLEMHPYTFRRDALPPGFANFEEQLEFFYAEVGVGALFCDHPDVAVAVRERLVRHPAGADSSGDAVRSMDSTDRLK